MGSGLQRAVDATRATRGQSPVVTHLPGHSTTQRTRCGNLIRPGGKRTERLRVVDADPTCGRCRRFGKLEPRVTEFPGNPARILAEYMRPIAKRLGLEVDEEKLAEAIRYCDAPEPRHGPTYHGQPYDPEGMTNG
jgi:hypothetical protein